MAPADTAPASATATAAAATNALVRNELDTATPSWTLTTRVGRHGGRLDVHPPGGHEIARARPSCFHGAGVATGARLRP